ncbi:unnamed protein product [Arabis nemorensis]|uniref:Uncharacterized protein n=1 Tax=Arabis nemorensis TaxID=586526 RepID=A0A565AM51_9BRAS|nr:unnamed protein product [Arabis nemorensis]
MNSSNKEWERLDSLEEEEALVWDLSVTLPTKCVSGIKKDSYISVNIVTILDRLLLKQVLVRFLRRGLNVSNNVGTCVELEMLGGSFLVFGVGEE